MRLSFPLRPLFTAATLAFFAAPVAAGTLHVWTSPPEGFNTHSLWYDDGQEVTVVDTQFTPAIAEALIADIRKATRSPITRVIITHPNPDKFNATAVFHREGIESIASRATAQALPGVDAYKRHFWVQVAKAFTEESYPKPEAIRTTFSGQTTLRLKSGETLSLIELARPGISSTQTVVRFDATGDLAVGDLVHHKTHAWLEGGIVDGAPKPDIPGWIEDLRALPGLGKGKVYGGRGEAVAADKAASEQIRYLETADRIVGDYVKALGKEADAAFGAPDKAQPHFKAIRDQLAKAFPDYAMPDLVAYSVYGLVKQKLAGGPRS